MDRPIELSARRRVLVRRILAAAGILLAAGIVFSWGTDKLRPSVSRDRVRFARVDAGSIEATITAAGTVVPEFEQVLSSPIDARVLRVLKRAGSTVAAGDAVLELDTQTQQVAVDRLRRQMALKENQAVLTKLDLDSRLNALDSEHRVKQLQLESYRSKLDRERQLREEGLVSKEELQQSELAVSQAEVELARIDGERRAARASTAATLDGLRMELATARGDAADAERQLRLAALGAERAGVVTWTLGEEGGTIRSGEAVARIADLTTFRVDATLSDVHAQRVHVGQPVSVKVGDQLLEGAVSTILPKVENGVMTVQVTLTDSRSPLLRSNLRVDAYLVTGRKARVLRVARGPFADGEGAREVFVVRGNVAVKTPVELGLASYDHFEVVRGLVPGDEIIVSDMRDYLHLREVRVR